MTDKKTKNNKDFAMLKRTIAMKIIFKVFIYTAITFLLLNILVDGIYNDELANRLSYLNRDFYWFIVDHKSEVLIVAFIIIFAIASYLVFKKTLNYMEEMMTAIDKVIKEPAREINLNNDLVAVENNLNIIRMDLIKRQNEAKDAEQKKNDLIAYMAHDLKTPLTSIIGYLTLLNDEKQISKEMQEKYIKIALDKSLRVEELTNQFFEITRYNLKDMPINKQMIDISYLLDQLAEECYPMLEDKNLKLQMNKPSRIEYLGDGDKLARAFENLIKNAINYSYNDTIIEINVKDSSVYDNEEIQSSENEIILEFKNKGNKIPEHKLDKIFEKFYRADESRESSSGGSGLGLAITKQIVELHNGNITVKNDDEYIIFTVILKK